MPTWFVSGHPDLTPSEFVAHYTKPLGAALSEPEARFVLADAPGAAGLAREYLAGARAEVCVFHVGEAPRCAAGATRGGFATEDERDAAMTDASDADIAWVRPGMDDSATASNLARRGPVASPSWLDRVRSWLGR